MSQYTRTHDFLPIIVAFHALSCFTRTIRQTITSKAVVAKSGPNTQSTVVKKLGST